MSLADAKASHAEAREVSNAVQALKDDTVTSLDFFFPLESPNWSKLLDALKTNESLVNLSIEFELGEEHPARHQVLTTLAKHCPKLSRLSLSNLVRLHGDRQQEAVGARAVTPLLLAEKLHGLLIPNCLLGDGGAGIFAQALMHNSTLSTLDLRHCGIRDRGAELLMGSLEINRSLTSLNLESNLLGDDGVSFLAKGVLAGSRILTLCLGDNCFGPEGCKVIAEMLKQSLTLTSLMLRNSCFNDAAQHLSEALSRNAALTSLDLSFNKLDGDFADAFVQGLAQNTTLRSLRLQGNNLGDQGARSFAWLLGNRQSLTSLNLCQNSLSDDAAIAFSENLALNTSLLTLDMGHNHFTDLGAICLADMLKTNSTLQHLGFVSPKLSNKGMTYFLDALEFNFCLNSVDLQIRGTEIRDPYLIYSIKANAQKNLKERLVVTLHAEHLDDAILLRFLTATGTYLTAGEFEEEVELTFPPETPASFLKYIIKDRVEPQDRRVDVVLPGGRLLRTVAKDDLSLADLFGDFDPRPK